MLAGRNSSALVAPAMRHDEAVLPSTQPEFFLPFMNPGSEDAMEMNYTSSILRFIVVGLVLAMLPVPLGATEPGAEWNRFRGPDGRGVLDQCKVPLPWSPSDVAWEIELPGRGNGSPVVYGDRIFLMSADPDTAERYLLCYDVATGRELWRRSYPSQPHHLHQRSSYASSTPCATEEAVYFSWGSPDSVILKALTHDGKELWTRDFGRFVSQHGYGASPIVYGDKVILFNSQQAQQLPPGVEPGQSRVICVDARSGETLWETPRTTTRACYGIPALFSTENGEAALLFANTGDGIFALRLSDGKPLWNQKLLSKRSVSTPQIAGELAIGTEGSGGGGNVLYAVYLHGDHRLKFKIARSAPYVPCPVVKDDLLFLWDDRGIVSCVDLKTGETLAMKRVGGNTSTSPVIAGDRLIGISEEGTVTILTADPKLEKLGTVELGETTRATPVLRPDYILLRTNSRLIRVGRP
ncbi:MAG: serine/threonine protein kinase [Planctomycetota bacterium]|nr:MAG: serine/threonine protein kinase [Planctomycetota bacterium]